MSKKKIRKIRKKIKIDKIKKRKEKTFVRGPSAFRTNDDKVKIKKGFHWVT